MVDVTVTAAEVLKAADSEMRDGILGETATAGEVVYLDSVTNTYKLANTETSATTADAKGVLLNGGGASQTARMAIAGTIDPGFTVTIGTIYVLSTAGGIAPAADLASNDWVFVVGVGITASSLKLIMVATGIQVP